MSFAEKCDEKKCIIEEPHYLQKAICPNFGHIEMLPLPEGKYNVIAIDPPWNYGTEYS